MQHVADWLEKLGLSEYAKRFAENRIDFSVLPELTDQDLEKIGVVLGDRRKILRAIRELGGTTPAAQHPLTAAAKPQDTAERRQVTVMFSDLVGSTALSARVDPEDLREVISAYQKCVANTVQRFGGFVAKYMGGGVLVYFGYPQAREDDSERAVRAGLELIAAVNALKAGTALQTRVGIATGLVVVGDLIGAGEAQERHRRRDNEPRSTTAKHRRAEHSRHRREHTEAARQSVRAGRPRRTGPQRHSQCCLGQRCGQARMRAALRRCTRPASRPSSDAKKNSNCCCGVGREQRAAKAKCCCSQARPGSARYAKLRGRARADHGRVRRPGCARPTPSPILVRS